MSVTKTFLHPRSGKSIGRLDEKGIFRKRVKRSVHLFRILNAWGIEETVVNQLRKLECGYIDIYDTEEKKHYVINFNVFDYNGIRRDFETPQVFLPLNWFANEKTLPRTKKT